jgi:para-nitrobenzyl esterase
MRNALVLVTVALVACAGDLPTGTRVAAVTDPTQVDTESGVAQGTLEGGMRVFRGLRYAAPPLGDLRWRDPGPPPACDGGVCDATQFGPPCLQKGPNGPRGSEDCLTLNVFTPMGAAPGANRPVLFFVHGGGFKRGTARSQVPIPPPIVADEDVVVVTIEYRLNVFGFLTDHRLALESGGSGDYGYLDAVAALEWVQRNITSFGGDPSHVMLFGQSAGASTVGVLMAAPRAAGLFASAGMESGPLGEGQPLPSAADCESEGPSLAAAAGCDTATDVLACLRATPALDLFDAWGHVVDGPLCVDVAVDGRLNTAQPLDTIRAQKTVPFLIGDNNRELGIDLSAPYTADDYTGFVHSFFDRFGADVVDNVLALYPLASYPSPAAAINDFYDDFEFGRGDRAWALAAAGPKPAADKDARPVFKYFFTHTMENDPDEARQGAYHTLELAFVFGTITAGQTQYGVDYTATPAELELAHQIEGYWARFAATGDPNGGGAVVWPRYQPRSEKFLRLDDTIVSDARYHSHQLDYLGQFNSHD